MFRIRVNVYFWNSPCIVSNSLHFSSIFINTKPDIDNVIKIGVTDKYSSLKIFFIDIYYK